MRKELKHCILQCFCFPSAAKNCQTIAQKRPKTDFQKHLIILASFFPAPDPQKRENTVGVKDFGGRRALTYTVCLVDVIDVMYGSES